MNTIVLSHALYKPGMDILQKSGSNLIVPNNGDSDVIIEDLKKADGFILRIGKIDKKAIQSCPNLKVITRPGVGVDNVDVKAATECGIPVVICPAVNQRSVAEHAIALVFACAKDLVYYDRETRKGNFAVRNEYNAIEIQGKKIAVLGLGKIGNEVANLAKAIGMNVVGYDPVLNESDILARGFRCASTILDAVQSSDFVTLHMPLIPSTSQIINKQVFSQMGKNSFLINCARGGIVNERDLFEALREGTIAGAAVDVLSSEPMDSKSPLMGLDNFIVSPHSAAQTKEATTLTVKMAAEGTLAVLQGEKWANVCNPEVYETKAWKMKPLRMKMEVK